MSEEAKKDNSAPWINYRTDHAEEQLARERKSANEDANKAKGLKQAEIGDALGGEVKTQKQILKAGVESQGKAFAEKYLEGKTPESRIKEMEVTKEAVFDKKDLHLKSTTTLTDPDTVKQNLKSISNREKSLPENPTFRGGPNGRGGGAGGGLFKEPDEILKEKNDALDPKDLLSQKHNDKQQKQETQQQQAQHISKDPQNEGLQKLSARERTDIAKAAKDKTVNESGTIDMANESGRMSIKERISKANARKEITSEKATVVKGKNKEVAINKVKQVSPKTIKR